jgi:superfamily II DNA or RNA helicase
MTPHVLRPYQSDCCRAVITDWRDGSAQLVVMPTGTGKTVVFLAIAEEFLRANPGKKVLILAHREELIFQPVEHWRRMTGDSPLIEMGAFHAGTSLQAELFDGRPDDRIIIGTVQSLNSSAPCRNCGGTPCGFCIDGRRYRMQKFMREDIGLVIVDEAHHAVAETYRRILNYFGPMAKILGVTATPDRADEEALGQIFQTVPFSYQISDAINDGWLVPIEQRFVFVEELDFSNVRATAGDLNEGDLEKLIREEKTLHRIAGPTIELAEDRPVLAFTPGVSSAERLAEIFNRHRSGSAVCITGATPRERRRHEIQNFQSGRRQYLVGCGVFLEGFDAPATACICMARPTKSRALYAQTTGRGTRPLTGIVDGIEAAEDRRTAIAVSGKPNLLQLDFVGNSGRHKLICTADILGDDYEDDVVERATAKVRKSGKARDMQEALEEADQAVRAERKQKQEEAERRQAAQRRGVTGKATYGTRVVNPFDVYDTTPKREPGWHKGRRPTARQLETLSKFKIDLPPDASFWQVSQLLDTAIGRMKAGLATYKQVRLMEKHGFTDALTVTMAEASRRIDALAQNGWKRTGQPQGI